MTEYPGVIPTIDTVTDDVDDVLAVQYNKLVVELLAVITELGTDPAGSATDVKTRLSKILSSGGFLQLLAATTLTISSGSATPTQNFHRFDTQGGGASDDLDTLTAMGEGWILIARIVDDGRNVVIKHNTGNILCPAAKDITLDTTADLALLIYDDVIDRWLVLASVSGAQLGANNVFTGNNTFSGGMKYKQNTVTTNTTLDASYMTVNVNAASAPVTITLPAAASAGDGTDYKIRKSDSSANSVTIDGNGSETINGATTHVLTAQYQSVILECDGSGWMVF